MHPNVLKYLGLIVCLGLIIIMFIDLRLSEVAGMPPKSVHTWRQFDCVAITDHLYTNNANIFFPKTYYAKDDQTGYAVGEFPLVNGIVSILYKIFSKDWAVYRLTVFVFSIIGFLFLYLLVWQTSSNWLFSASIPVFLFASPVISYYSINFLPDLPSLALLFMGIYFWILFYQKRRNKFFIIGVLALTFSALLKITSAIALISILIIEIFILLRHKKVTLNFLFSIPGILIIVIWYIHAHQLDSFHPTAIFLTEGRGIWQTSSMDRSYINQQIWNVWIPFLYPGIGWIILIGGCITSLFFTKSKYFTFFVFQWLVILGCLAFFLLMYRQFMWHDYLFIIPIGFFILPLVWIGYKMQQSNAKWINYFIAIVFFTGSYFTFLHAKTEINQRYFSTNNFLNYNPDLFTIKPKLRENGINEEDLVLSIPDNSPNITLTMMQQNGFTNYKDIPSDSISIQKRICLGVKYLIISKPSELNNPGIKPFLKNRLFIHESIYVFDVREFDLYCH